MSNNIPQEPDYEQIAIAWLEKMYGAPARLRSIESLALLLKQTVEEDRAQRESDHAIWLSDAEYQRFIGEG